MDKIGGTIATVDIGTSSVTVIVARINKFSKLEIIHVETIPTKEVVKGEIIEPYKIADGIKKIFGQFEMKNGIKIKSCYVNIPNKYVTAEEVEQEVSIDEKIRTVQEFDIEKLLNKVRDTSVQRNQKVIDLVPLEYYDDMGAKLINPLHHNTTKLRIKAQIFVAMREYIEKVEMIMQYSSIKISGIIPQSYANAKLLLTPEQMEKGTLLIDVGGNTTDISIYLHNRLIYMDSLNVGGDTITNDISLVLDITKDEAEKIKMQYPLAMRRYIENDLEIKVMGNDAHQKIVNTSELIEIIEARCEETLSTINNNLMEIDAKRYIQNVVMIGKGFNSLNKIDKLATRIFGKETQLVNFKHTNQIKPIHTTAYAMQEYILFNNLNMNSELSIVEESKEYQKQNMISKIWDKAKDFLYT